MLDRTFNTITAAEWRGMTPEEREEFTMYWNRKGFASFQCLNCGFPTEHGQARCEACREEVTPATDVIK